MSRYSVKLNWNQNIRTALCASTAIKFIGVADAVAIADHPNFELLWVERTDSSSKIYISALYHPPRPIYDAKELLIYIKRTKEELTTRNPEALIILGGDLNQLSEQNWGRQDSTTTKRNKSGLDRIYVSALCYLRVQVVTWPLLSRATISCRCRMWQCVTVCSIMSQASEVQTEIAISECPTGSYCAYPATNLASRVAQHMGILTIFTKHWLSQLDKESQLLQKIQT